MRLWSVLSSFSQDLIARQAPIDKKLKSVDSLALQKQIRAEQSEYPALSLYPNWIINMRILVEMRLFQNTYTIDLTGFVCRLRVQKNNFAFLNSRWRRMHNGLDLKVNIGDTIVSAFDGKGTLWKYERRGYGKYVVIRHDNGLKLYMDTCLSSWLKKPAGKSWWTDRVMAISDVLQVRIFISKPASGNCN